ncbi:hypothetical protein NHX12_025819 [Muraenolepis orangiensis]|uniref:RecA family profile 1 domain-containing protein n=1 Tax=Muraenolepis orangiensis TaxID=630683 RepID=A0A9Q0IQ65_9TELE|nr:hypothetical protein NHX12_025819 [Muraenolepis orangiensis]
MASKKLRRAGVSPQVCELLKRHRVESCQDLLSLSPLEVMRLAGLSHQRALSLLRSVSTHCAPPVATLLELWKPTSESFFSTSLPALDRLLRGGLPRGTITEVAGPSGCGKTQMCVMLSVLATLPSSLGGLDAAVVYIDTEAAFSAQRLVGMAQARFPHHFSSRERLLQMAGRVHVFRELTCQDILNSLPGNLATRSNLLSHQASVLKYLAHRFNIPVVLTNQITTHLGNTGSEAPGQADSGFVTAALGNTWSHTVNTRLIVQYGDGRQRQIVIAKSPVAPYAVLNYTIQQEGIRLHEGGNQEPMGETGDPVLQPIRVRTEFNYSLSRPAETDGYR